MKIETLEKIAIVLKIDVRDFFEESNDTTSLKGNIQVNNNLTEQLTPLTDYEKEIAHLKERINLLEQVITDKERTIQLLLK